MAPSSAKSGGCRHFALGTKWHGTLMSHRQCKDLHDLQVAIKQAKAVCITPVRAGLHQRLSPTHMSLGLSKAGLCSAVWQCCLRSALRLPLSMVLPPASSSFLVLPQPAILKSRQGKSLKSSLYRTFYFNTKRGTIRARFPGNTLSKPEQLLS